MRALSEGWKTRAFPGPQETRFTAVRWAWAAALVLVLILDLAGVPRGDRVIEIGGASQKGEGWA